MNGHCSDHNAQHKQQTNLLLIGEPKSQKNPEQRDKHYPDRGLKRSERSLRPECRDNGKNRQQQQHFIAEKYSFKSWITSASRITKPTIEYTINSSIFFRTLSVLELTFCAVYAW